MASCKECKGKCCKYITVEIDGPFSKEDVDAMRWYLCHENVCIFMDNDGDWLVEFATKCKHLDEDFNCKDYENRSDICRDHGLDECELFGEGEVYQVMFKEPSDIEKYIKENNIKLK